MMQALVHSCVRLSDLRLTEGAPVPNTSQFP